MDVLQAFNRIRNTFPSVAGFQGPHFRYAYRCDVWLIEQKRGDRYFYWLLWNGEKKIIHASKQSKLAPMRTIGDSFSPSLAYD